MINVWGICEFAEMTHDPLRRWEMCCGAFRPTEVKSVKEIDACCANCIFWLAADDHLEREGK